MAYALEPCDQETTASVVVGFFVLLAAAAWLASPGMSVAVVFYGAVLASHRIYRALASATRARRCSMLLGVAIVWIAVLAYCAAVLPSNLSAALA